MSLKRILFYLIAIMAVSSCSTTKYVGDGELLVDKAKVRVETDNKRLQSTQFKEYVRQRGNTRWFSVFKIPLGTYSLSGRDSTRWINRTLKKIGEAPVIFSEKETQRTQRDLVLKMQSLGYLQAQASYDVEVKGKKARINYKLTPGKAYYIDSVRYIVPDTAMSSHRNIFNSKHTYLKRGDILNLENLDLERKRITKELQNEGYYHFNKDYITYIADTVAASQGVTINLVVRRPNLNDTTQGQHRKYHIRTISYQSGNARSSRIPIRDAVLQRNTFIEVGSTYSARDLEKTYTRLGQLHAIKYTNIGFTEQPGKDSLDCTITLSTGRPQTISFQPEGTNTAGDFGFAMLGTYQHRNIFKGSETLTLEARYAFEAIKSLDEYAQKNFQEYSGEAKLTFPRFIAPFLTQEFRRRNNASSELSLRYNSQNRPEYRREVLSAGWRYKWNDNSHHDRYQFDLIDIDYVFMPWISETFSRDYLNNDSRVNAILKYNYDDLLITKMGFNFTYNNGKWAIKLAAETAGNLLGSLASPLGLTKNADGHYKVMNIAFAQYAKADVDFTRNIAFGLNNQLVFHVKAGVAYPYGNSSILPFEKRYFAGGPNSIRGWGVRELGPGKYKSSDGKINFINQTGDMKLEVNMEYRTKLVWGLGAAAFVDAGNIWTIRDYEDQKDGQFRWESWWKEIAVAYGIGIRFNFDYFVVRFDLGMKAVNPVYTSTKDHYPILNPRWGRDSQFHFAVGLPF